MFCGKCRKKVEENEKYCMSCGQVTHIKLQKEKKDELSCKMCKTTLKEGAKFCMECGNPVKTKIITEHSSNYGERKRHVITTFFILIGILYHTYLLINFLHFIFFINRIDLYQILNLIGFIGTITGLIFILCWKKIGFWLFIGSISIFFIASIIDFYRVNPRNIIIWSAIFWAILLIPKNGKTTWHHLR